MMKHRSLILFVIVGAVLTVIPQAAHDLGELKASIAGRVETGIWNAFLSLHAQKLVQPAASAVAHAPSVCAEQARAASPSTSPSVQPAKAAGERAGSTRTTVGARKVLVPLAPPAFMAHVDPEDFGYEFKIEVERQLPRTVRQLVVLDEKMAEAQKHAALILSRLAVRNELKNGAKIDWRRKFHREFEGKVFAPEEGSPQPFARPSSPRRKPRRAAPVPEAHIQPLPFPPA
ncbi:MAG: hypothetical protein ACRD68_06775, partial [Pyrinomonadaceae bacterium]